MINPQLESESKLESLALRLTRWMGSIPSLIIHTIIFPLSFALTFFGITFETILLVLTTAVSLEAIYLSLFIQMTVNKQAESIEDVAEDIDEIQEDIDEIQGDVDEIQEDVVGISADIDDISMETIYADLKRLIEDVEKYKQQNGSKS
jgi:low affinity Fe/Cu permease